MSMMPGLAGSGCEPPARWIEARPPGHWFKATASNGSCACVEVRLTTDGLVEIRDSKYLANADNDPAAQPVISAEPRHFADWVVEVCSAADSERHGTIISRRTPSGQSVVSSTTSDVELTFTPEEWLAFRTSARLGEFDLALAPA